MPYLGHSDLVDALTDYDKNDLLRIKHDLLGEHIDASLVRSSRHDGALVT